MVRTMRQHDISYGCGQTRSESLTAGSDADLQQLHYVKYLC